MLPRGQSELYKANAATKTPAAPPIKATAPVGRGPAGASPVLGAAPAAPEPEVEPLAAGAPDLAPEPDGVCDAEAGPDEVTIAYAEMYSIVETSSLDIIVVVVPRSDWSTT